MCRKRVSFEGFCYIYILLWIRQKLRFVTHFLRKMVSGILNFLVMSYSSS
ncbi:hypothetical protein HanIR_Chr11g0539651 [Helianthus annuus]|nr:hypothetical protein HanIR_Chr11g0539651 [Helianthus annuus]